MLVKRAALLCALCGFAATAAASDAMVLAPGKSVSVLDVEDPSIRVVVTAPADAPLDLGSLLSSAGPRESVYSIVTRMQVDEARALVQAPDGSISLGAASAIVLPTPNITGGLIVFHNGRYAHYREPPAPAVQVAGRPGEQLIRAKEEVPVPGRMAGPAPVQPGAPAVLPAGIALPSAVTLPLTTTLPVGGALATSSSFNIGAGNVANFQQPSGSSATLNAVSGGQVQIPGAITTTGGAAPGGNITLR